MKLKTMLLLGVGLCACSDSVAGPEPDAVPFTQTPSVASVHFSGNGATVLNQGSKDRSNWICYRFGLITHDLVINRRPNGGALLSCHWEDLGPIAETRVDKNFSCTIIRFDGHTQSTTRTHYTRTPSGQASMTCQFDKE